MSRNVSESVKKRVAGRQNFKCANSTNVTVTGLENYLCTLWEIIGDKKGCFNEAGYEIDHIKEHSISHDDDEKNLQALCLQCHSVKTKRFATRKAKSARENKNKKFYSDSSSSSEDKSNKCELLQNSKSLSVVETNSDESDNDYMTTDELIYFIAKLRECREKDKQRIAQLKEDIKKYEINILDHSDNLITCSSESDSEKSNDISYCIKLPISKSVWHKANEIVNQLSRYENIICQYDKKNHGYTIYKFNKITTLYQIINSNQLFKIIKKHKISVNDKYICDIILEICRLIYRSNLCINQKWSNHYLNGYYDTDKILKKRTHNDYLTICNNDYLCDTVRDYINTFYELTNNKKNKISKTEFSELYCVHNGIDNTNWKDMLKKSDDCGIEYNSTTGYFLGLKKIIFSCDIDIYHKFFNKHIKKTDKISDVIDEDTLINSFVKWYDTEIADGLKPTDKEIIHYFSVDVFKLSSRNGEEFPLTKLKIINI